jgi:hypothetical protein
MKTKFIYSTLLSFFSLLNIAAQDRTTVTATNSEISDNLDLRAVASIFGDSENLEDFERRLNDPKTPISNLDLNDDNQVDYLRVIENVQGYTHLIIIQSVLGRDLYQDIATIEVEKDRNNRIQVQVVGDVYMYGNNYIYEPVYYSTPVIYTNFWVSNYRPYCSSWYWDYYPSYYIAWRPFPIFRYRNHIDLCINFHHHYNYVNYRRSHIAYGMYNGRRSNAYEMRYPKRSFSYRNNGYANRHELDNNRRIKTIAPRRDWNSNADTPRNSNGNIRNNQPRTYAQAEQPRGNNTRSYSNERGNELAQPNENRPRNYSSNMPQRSYNSTREQTPRGNSRSENITPSRSNTRDFSSPRGNSSRNENSRSHTRRT